MVQENLIRRLVFWNRFWLVLLISVVLGWGSRRFVANIHEDTDRLQGHISAEGLKLFTASGDPLVITHVVADEDSWAALPKPIPQADSGGPLITLEEMKKWQWHDRFNQPIAFPEKSTSFAALYYRTRRTEVR